MRELIRPLLLVAIALAIPVIPFLLFGDQLEATIIAQLNPPPSRSVVVLLVVGVLATDIFLPVPSSAVSTIAGVSLGAVLGSAASMVGMTLGAAFGFWLARRFGPAAANRFAKPEDLAKIESLAAQFGPGLLLLLRPLPVLAEASVLIFGVGRLEWRRFLPAVLFGNAVISVLYATLGELATDSPYLPAVIIASMAFPLLLTELVRRRMKTG